jgi:hypothetical protein
MVELSDRYDRPYLDVTFDGTLAPREHKVFDDIKQKKVSARFAVQLNQGFRLETAHHPMN